MSTQCKNIDFKNKEIMETMFSSEGIYISYQNVNVSSMRYKSDFWEMSFIQELVRSLEKEYVFSL